MTHSNHIRIVATTVLVLAAASSLLASPALAATVPLSFAVIGDTPYGSTQLADFAGKITQINADPDVTLVNHLGDISEPPNCTTAYYSKIKGLFNTFTDPMVYTPGDNEWADCSAASAGSYDPLERLTTLRRVMYPTPGTTLGQNPITVTSQNSTGMPENVRFVKGGISFAAVNVAGSNNDLKVWARQTAVTPEQKADACARVNAEITLMHNAFVSATSKGSRAVVLLTQADMFDSSRSDLGPTYKVAFTKLAQAIATETAAFGKPVLLLNGDSHHFVQDQPLTLQYWLDYYGIPDVVPNLTRVTIEGGDLVAEWLKVSVIPDESVLKIERIPFQ